MDQDYKRVLSGIREHSPLHDLAEKGAAPQDVKAVLFGFLSPYLSNPDTLERFGLAVLVPDAVVVARIQQDPWADRMLRTLLYAHRHAAKVDERAAFAAYGDWEADVQRGLSHWWSGYYLESDKSRLPLYEFVHETSRNMGAVIEACLQPLLRELLQLTRCARGRQATKQDIVPLDFGVVVGELIDSSAFPDLLRPEPWRIRINQWRNMAQHFGLAVHDRQVVGTYGPAHNRRTIVLSRGEFLGVLRKVVLVFNIVKQARTLFVLDNTERIAPYLPETELRPEHGIVCLASAMATQGFEMVDFRVEQGPVRAVVRDVTDGEPKRRMLHASQFVCPVWYHFPRGSVTVVYEDKQGQPRLTTVANGEDCREVSEGRVPFEELANRVQFVPHTDGN
jgi:hypothetical protein